MYRIEDRNYGLRMYLSGFMRAEEMEDWLRESENAVSLNSVKIGILIDMTGQYPILNHNLDCIRRGLDHFVKMGVGRTAVVLGDTVNTIKLELISRKDQEIPREYFIDASTEPEWEQKALEWIVNGIVPDW